MGNNRKYKNTINRQDRQTDDPNTFTFIYKGGKFKDILINI